MKTLTIRRRIIASFAIVLALMVFMAGGGAQSACSTSSSRPTFIGSDAVPGLTYTNRIVVDEIANYSLTQEFVLQSRCGGQAEAAERPAGQARPPRHAAHRGRGDHHQSRREEPVRSL